MSTKIRLRALFALLAVAVLSVGIAACGDDDEPTSDGGGGLIESNPDNSGVQITVGSKNFAEQYILGEIYAQGLEAAGYDVSKDLNLGDETVALKALKAGEIDGYPEYTSTALTSFFDTNPEDVAADAQEAYEQSQADFENEGLVSYPPTPYNSANAVGTADLHRRRARARERLRPRGPVAGPDALRLAGVPPAARLPGGAPGRLRPGVQVVHPGRHRAALRGARQGARPTSRSCSRATRSCSRTRTSTRSSRTTRASSRPGTSLFVARQETVDEAGPGLRQRRSSRCRGT